MRANGIRGQRCLDLFFLELKKHREKLLKDKSTTTQAYLQRTIKTFLSPITPTNATSPSRSKQMGSQPRHNKVVTIDRAIKISHARSPPAPCITISTPLSLLNKDHYLPRSLQRPLHFGSTYARDLSRQALQSRAKKRHSWRARGKYDWMIWLYELRPPDCCGQARWKLSFPDHRPELSWRCILSDFSYH